MKKTILCFGDSNTFGYSGDPSEKKGRFNKEQRWTGILDQELGDNFQIVEAGENGRTTIFQESSMSNSTALADLPSFLEKEQSISLLIIFLGSNDCQNRFQAQPHKLKNAMKEIVQRAKSCQESLKILLVAPPIMTDKISSGTFSQLMGEGASEKSMLLPSLYKEIANEEKCYYFDTNDQELLPNLLNSIDFLHLSMDGHRRLAESLKNIVFKILK